MIKSTKRKVTKKAKKASKIRSNPQFIGSQYPFGGPEYFQKEIEREVRAKSRIAIASLDGKFRIIGVIKKRKNGYVVEVENTKYGIIDAIVTFEAEDVIEGDYDTATFTLR